MTLKIDTHVRLFKTVLIIASILACNINSFAQVKLLDSLALAVHEEYSDLDSAVKNPDSVVKLVLRKKKNKEFSQYYSAI